MAYNAACALIEKRNFAEAQEFLLLARRIGKEMLIEEEYTEEEIETELAPISVQLAYVQQALGNSGDAMTAYNNILNQKLADAPSIAVATNNLIALKGAKDVFDGLKKFDKLIDKSGTGQGLQLADSLEHKLSARQKEVIYCKRLLLLRDIDGEEDVFNATIERWSSNMGEYQHTLESIMLEIASFKLKHKKVEEAADLLNDLSKVSHFLFIQKL